MDDRSHGHHQPVARNPVAGDTNMCLPVPGVLLTRSPREADSAEVRGYAQSGCLRSGQLRRIQSLRNPTAKGKPIEGVEAAPARTCPAH